MNTQLEFQASASKSNCSQVERLRGAFFAAGEGVEIPMPELARIMSPTDKGTGNCPPRRIYDLKKKIERDGWTIVNRTEHRDGQVLSWYRLVRLSPLPSTLPTQTPNNHSSP